MVTPHEAEINLDAYARLSVAVARAGGEREKVLAAHGLDEDRWQAIDEVWQTRVSDAVDTATEEAPVPKLLEDFQRAMEAAQKEDAAPCTLERFIQATVVVRRGGDVTAALRRIGMAMEEYMRAGSYWTKRIAEDEELAARFSAGVG